MFGIVDERIDVKVKIDLEVEGTCEVGKIGIRE